MESKPCNAQTWLCNPQQYVKLKRQVHLGMQGCAASYSNATWCKQTFDGSCTSDFVVSGSTMSNNYEYMGSSRMWLVKLPQAIVMCHATFISAPASKSLSCTLIPLPADLG